MNTHPQRLLKELRALEGEGEGGRLMLGEDGACWALVNLGPTFNRYRAVHCSRRALPGAIVCGQHEHLIAALEIALGERDLDDYLRERGWIRASD